MRRGTKSPGFFAVILDVYIKHQAKAVFEAHSVKNCIECSLCTILTKKGSPTQLRSENPIEFKLGGNCTCGSGGNTIGLSEVTELPLLVSVVLFASLLLVLVVVVFKLSLLGLCGIGGAERTGLFN